MCGFVRMGEILLGIDLGFVQGCHLVVPFCDCVMRRMSMNTRMFFIFFSGFMQIGLSFCGLTI